MPVFNTKVTLLPTFPSRVISSGFSKITKTGATYSFGNDFRQLIVDPIAGNSSDYIIAAQNVTTGAFSKVALGTGFVSWDNIASKPATFPPSAHTHLLSEISDASPAGRALVAASTSVSQRALLGLVIGTDVAPANIEVLYPETYGAYAGATDQTALWNAVEAARAAGKWLDFRGQTFTLSARKVLTTAGVYKWRNLDLLVTTTGDGTEIAANGSLFTNRTLLTANASAGAASVTVASAAGYAVGDDVLIMSNDDWDAGLLEGAGLKSKKSEFHTIASIVSNTITLQSSLACTYTTAATGRIMKCPFDIEIWTDNVTMRAATLGAARVMLDLSRCKPRDMSFKTYKSGSVGLQTRACDQSGMVLDIHGEDTYNPANPSTSSGYIFNPAGNKGGVVRSMTGARTRHAHVNGNCGGTTQSATAGDDYIIARGLSYLSTYVLECYAGPVDTHNGCTDINHGSGYVTMHSSALAGEDAIVIQGANITIGDWHVGGNSPRSLVLVQPYGQGDDLRENIIKIGRVSGSSKTTDGYAINVEYPNIAVNQPVTVLVDSIDAEASGGIALNSTRGAITCSIQNARIRRKERDGIVTIGLANPITLDIQNWNCTESSGASVASGVYTQQTNHTVTITNITQALASGSSSHYRGAGGMYITGKETLTGSGLRKYDAATVVYKSRPLVGTATIDIPSLAAGADFEFDFTVTGASTSGDRYIGVSTPNNGKVLPLGGRVISANTVRVTWRNLDTVAVDPASAFYTCFVEDLT